MRIYNELNNEARDYVDDGLKWIKINLSEGKRVEFDQTFYFQMNS